VFRESRTTYPTILERLLLGTNNINYHLDHHLYPSVPFYNLPALHDSLLKTKDFRENAHITTTYLGVLRECLSSPPKAPAQRS
jgi:fatty acid desaturase